MDPEIERAVLERQGLTKKHAKYAVFWFAISVLTAWGEGGWLTAVPALACAFYALKWFRAVGADERLIRSFRSGVPTDKSTSGEAGQARVDRWNDAINAYGALIEAHPGSALPESRLPLQKEEMKAALKFAWLQTNDAYMRKMIERGFLELSMFRPEIASEVTISMGSLDPNAPIQELAQSIIDVADTELAVLRASLDEQRMLLQEFTDFKEQTE